MISKSILRRCFSTHNLTKKTPITVAYGDGIGPEIMTASLDIIKAAGAQLELETIEIGEKVYARGISSGIEDKSWDSLLRTKVFLKAPITTPQGAGVKSLNVTTRKALGLYANVRPCISYHPFVGTKHPKMDVVIVRENEEDLYAGIEHRQTLDSYQCLKIISRPGCEKIIRYAFNYAVQNGRKKVTCFAKDNIMKFTDGLFHKIFDEIGQEYPNIEKEFWIVDIGAAKLADSPHTFDVIVMPNLYGDILSDVAAQIAGSVGLAGSSNIGTHAAMFEAIHGSAPRRANQNLANPSGLLLASVMMLNHIGQNEVAERVHNAWLSTIERGIHTYDIFKEGISKQKVGTKEFARAVIDHLGTSPQTLPPVKYEKSETIPVPPITTTRPYEKKELVGADIFVEFTNGSVQDLAKTLQQSQMNGLKLEMISNRGTTVWPHGLKETFCIDVYRCRFKIPDNHTSTSIPHNYINFLLQSITNSGLEYVKTELLYNFNGKPGFTKGQGQ